MFILTKRQRFFFGFLVILSSHRISDDPKVLTHGILGLSLGFLLNHRGSSMNLRFESIHGVLTREFLLIIKKKKVKRTKQRKRNRKKEYSRGL